MAGKNGAPDHPGALIRTEHTLLFVLGTYEAALESVRAAIEDGEPLDVVAIAPDGSKAWRTRLIEPVVAVEEVSAERWELQQRAMRQGPGGVALG